MEEINVPRRVLGLLLHSIASGVVPRVGAPYIAIGRGDEIAALLSDLALAEDGGSSMRFLIGKYGSGKSFFMQLIRGYALERGFLTADADLSPERRICGVGGTGIATYRELLKNLACRASPDGGALPMVVARWVSSIRTELGAAGLEPGSVAYAEEFRKRVWMVAHDLQEMVGGFDFASVVVRFAQAEESGDEESKAACLRWLRGEYRTKTEARSKLDVNSVIGDANWFDSIKLLTVFARKTGYRGLVVFLDECVNLYKIPNRISRENNYEKLLSMFNDALQGRSPGLVMVLSGIPQFLEDTRRGLFSYEALRSRLCDSRFAKEGLINTVGPVLRLRRLSDDELYALITRMTRLHAQYYHWEPRITEQDRVEFLRYCLARAGADAMITPREILRDYTAVLNLLLQNESLTFGALLQNEAVVSLHHGDESIRESARTADFTDTESKRQGDFSPADIEL